MIKKALRIIYRKERDAENTLVAKLDFFILTYACLSYFASKLDSTNLSNAWASGMPEDIGMDASQFSKITALFQAGYALGQLPANLLLVFFPPRYVLPCFCAGMGLVSLGQSFTENESTIQGLRFLLGITEAANYTTISYVLGSWFHQGEMAKRAGIYTSFGHLGSVISGPIQSGINQSLAGVMGREGWRWLFIIDACITFPIALWGTIALPDSPSKTKAFYLTDEERFIARTRMKPRDQFVWKKESLLTVVKSWQWYTFMLMGCIMGMLELLIFNSMAPLFFRSYPDIYSVSDANNLPSIGYCMAMFSNLAGAAITDYLGNRFYASVFMFVGGFIGSTIFLVYPEGNQAALQAAIYIQGLVFAGQACYFTWANECSAYDPFLRTFVVGSMNLAGYIWLIWYGIVVYTSDDAPRFRNGNIGSLIASLIVMPFAAWILWKAKRTPGAVIGKYSKQKHIEEEAEAQAAISSAAERKDASGSSGNSSDDADSKDEKEQMATSVVAPANAPVPTI